MYGYYQAPSVGQLIVALLFGALIGALFSDKLRPYRKYIWYLLGLILVIASFKVHVQGLPLVTFFIIGFVVAIKLLRDKLIAQQNQLQAIYGTAKLADLAHLQQNGLVEPVELAQEARA